MYQITLKGYFETENPDEFVASVKEIAEKQNVDLVGVFQIFQLAPYVDYQKADVTDPQD